MSDNINISGIDFKKLPEDFNIENAAELIDLKTGTQMQDKLPTINLLDGLDRDEAEFIISEINTDDNMDEITNEEINAFCKAKDLDVAQITKLVQGIVVAANDALKDVENPTNTDDPQEPAGTEEPGETTPAGEGEDDLTDIKVSVQKWGSAAEDGNKYANDCLDHIMKNYYPDIVPYSTEWYEKETEIMNANPSIYGDESGNGARPAIGGGGRHNAVIYENDEITLPGIKQPAENNGNDGGDVQQPDNPTEVTAGKIPEDATLDKTEDLGNGITLETYIDSEGNVVGQKQYNGEEQMWESTITPGEDDTSIETKIWTQSGLTETTIFDKDGKEIEKNSLYPNGNKSKVTFTHNSDGTKSGAITVYDADDNEIGSGTAEYDADGRYTESITYTGGENEGNKIETKYDKYGQTVENTCEKPDGSKVVTIYGSGVPLQASGYTSDGKVEFKREFEIADDGSVTVTETNFQDDGSSPKTYTVTTYDSEGNVGETCTVTYDESGNPVQVTGNVELLPQEIQDAIQGLTDGDNPNEQVTRDDQGRITEKKVTDDSGNLQYTETYTYNDDGTYTKKTVYENPNAQNIIEMERVYGEDGVISGHYVFASGLEANQTNTYNDDGSYKVEYIYSNFEDKGEGIYQKVTEIYDTEGKLVEKDSVMNGNEATGTVSTHEEYENGVLKSKIETEANTNITRAIEYYDDGTTVKSIIAEQKDSSGNIIATAKAEYDENGNVVGTIEGDEAMLKWSQPAQPQTNASNEEEELRADMATAKAQALHAAMDRAGTDEDVVRDIINNTTGQDLVDVINAYEEMYGTTLEDAIKGDFSWVSGESELLTKLSAAQAEVDAYNNMRAANPDLNPPARTPITKEMVQAAQLQAFQAATSNRLGTDERVLFDMFQGMDDEELKDFIKYCETQNVDVKEVIKSETSFETQKSLIQRIEMLEGTQPNARTNVDEPAATERSEDQIRADIATAKAQALHAAMDRAGTDEEVVRDIINNTTGQDLVDIIEEYERLFGTTLEDAIKGDFSFMSGEGELLAKLSAAKAEVDAYNNMRAANPDLNPPARTPVTLEDLHKAQLQAFKAATSNRPGTDEKIVYQMLQNGSMTDDDIRALDSALKSEGSSLIALLKSEFSGETLKALIRRVESLGIKEKEDEPQT